jgi:hypothetical protein
MLLYQHGGLAAAACGQTLSHRHRIAHRVEKHSSRLKIKMWRRRRLTLRTFSFAPFTWQHTKPSWQKPIQQNREGRKLTWQQRLCRYQVHAEMWETFILHA